MPLTKMQYFCYHMGKALKAPAETGITHVCTKCKAPVKVCPICEDTDKMYCLMCKGTRWVVDKEKIIN